MFMRSLSAATRIVFTCFLICIITISKIGLLSAQEHSKHTYIEQQVNRFIEDEIVLFEDYPDSHDSNENITISVREIDSRIQIPDCKSPYQFDSNQRNNLQSNLSVKVTCPDTEWYLFVHAKISVTQKVVVSRENLSPGALLSKSDLTIIEVDKNRLRGSSFDNVEEVAGARIKRRIRAGHIINDRMLCFICKGDRVTIAAVSGNLQVKVYGVAEQDGVLGDTIQVRNISSNKLIFARVASTSQVEINI